MKNLVRYFVMLMFISIGSKVYAQNWIPYQEVVQTPVIYVQQPQQVIVYQWIPYVVQQNIIVEQHRFFCRTQTVVTKPITQWILQPVVIYR